MSQLKHPTLRCIDCPISATMEGHLMSGPIDVTVDGLHFKGTPGYGHLILTGVHTIYEITGNFFKHIRLDSVNESRIILHEDHFFEHETSSEIVIETGGTMIWQNPRRPSSHDPSDSFFVDLNDDGQFFTRGAGTGLLKAFRVMGEGG